MTVVGTVKKDGASDETLVISLLKTMDGSKFLGVIRTQSGDHKFFVPSALVNSKLKGTSHPITTTTTLTLTLTHTHTHTHTKNILSQRKNCRFAETRIEGCR